MQNSPAEWHKGLQGAPKYLFRAAWQMVTINVSLGSHIIYEFTIIAIAIAKQKKKQNKSLIIKK